MTATCMSTVLTVDIQYPICHPQSQGSVEWANADIKSMIISWTHENNNTHWSEGLRLYTKLC
jgi:hypothetical protein